MENLAVACVGFALLLASPILADEPSDAAVEAAALKAITAASPNSNAGIAKAVPGSEALVAAGGAAPGLIGHFMVVGPDELSDGLPCFFCAPAPGGGFGIGVTMPMGYIPRSQTVLDYSFMFQSVRVNATCTLAFALMQGTDVLDVNSFPAGIFPGTWVVTFPSLRPAASGAAVAHGFVLCNRGAQRAHMRTPVYLQ